MTQTQFTQTYLPHTPKMYALAYNLLRNQDEARDCLQDVFAELWQRRSTLDPAKPPLPLLLTMVRNCCLDRLRSRRTIADEDLSETLLDNTTGDRIEAQSTLAALLKRIACLPRDQQLVLRLRTIDGLEINQIEQLTGLSRANIYTLLSRARKTLRETVNEL